MSPEEALALDAKVQAKVVESALDELHAFWRSIEHDGPELARHELMQYMPYLVDKYGSAGGAAAADLYDELRSNAMVRQRFTAYAAKADLDAVARATQRLAGALFGDNLDRVLPGLASVVAKHVLNGGRDTIVENVNRDPSARGWYRIARPSACNFCVMLSQRGAVYDKNTVRFKAHKGKCFCRAAPSWDPKAPSVHTIAYVASARTSDMKPEQLAAHRARVRTWIASNQNQLAAFRSEL